MPRARKPGEKALQGGRTLGEQIRVQERITEIFELTKAGFDPAFIAQQLGGGITREMVRKVIIDHLRMLRDENKDLTREYKELQNERLNTLIASHWVRRADPRSADVLLRAIDKQCKLNGLDAPEVLVKKDLGDARLGGLSDEDLTTAILRRIGL